VIRTIYMTLGLSVTQAAFVLVMILSVGDRISIDDNWALDIMARLRADTTAQIGSYQCRRIMGDERLAGAKGNTWTS